MCQKSVFCHNTLPCGLCFLLPWRNRQEPNSYIQIAVLIAAINISSATLDKLPLSFCYNTERLHFIVLFPLMSVILEEICFSPWTKCEGDITTNFSVICWCPAVQGQSRVLRISVFSFE